MLEIAGGILIAVAIIVALPYILAGAYWVSVIGVGLAIVIGAWLILSAVVGDEWAWGISIAAFVIWLGWFGSQEARAKATLKDLLQLASAILFLVLVIGVGLAGLCLLAGAFMGIIILSIKAFGDIAGFVTGMFAIMATVMGGHWLERRHIAKSPESKQVLR